MDHKRVLVTGASSGIGRSIAELLLQQGFDVLGTSRDPQTIKNKLSEVKYFALDLQDPKSIDALIPELGDIDILINNAGQSQIGPLEEIPMEKVRSLFEINLFGIIQLTKAILPGMRARKKGTIINISSMSGIFGVGFTPVYCGSKFALEGVFRSLRQEVRSFGIKVVMIEPGYIATGLKQEPFLPEGSEYYESAKIFKGIRDHNIETGATPAEVAKKVLFILKQKDPKPGYPVGGDAPRNAFLSRILPIRLVEWFQRKKFKS
ncbi:MAG: SDR family oxidoreductase [Candidatus Marinimicrobia bacterium]|nr:SDR family oxidoreductase [Candidatus Neomarinimicrobiota bacterium]